MSDDLVPQEPSKTRRQRVPMAHTPEEILVLSSCSTSFSDIFMGPHLFAMAFLSRL